jgi:hypothetical protein
MASVAGGERDAYWTTRTASARLRSLRTARSVALKTALGRRNLELGGTSAVRPFSNRLKRIAFLRIGPAARIGRGDKASLAGTGGLIFRSFQAYMGYSELTK